MHTALQVPEAALLAGLGSGVAAEEVSLTEPWQTCPRQNAAILIEAVIVPFGGSWAQLKADPEVVQDSEGVTENPTALPRGKLVSPLTPTTTLLAVAGPLLVTCPVKLKYTGIERNSVFC
jgi:hypothetical protein